MARTFGLSYGLRGGWWAADGDLESSLILAAGGTVLGWLSSRQPASALGFLAWGFTWPDYLLTALALFWYARGVARIPRQRRPSRARRACFVCGVLLLFAVLQTGFLYFAEHMFFLHRVQHLALHHLAPFLIALAWPGEALLIGMPPWLSRPVRSVIGARPVRAVFHAVQQPVVASVLFVGLVFLWVWPPVHLQAMLDNQLFAVMDWSMVLDGLLFFCLLFDPRPVSAQGLTLAARIVLALSVQIPQIFLGALLLVAGRDLYPWYSLCGRAYAGIGPVADQQLGGLLILFGGGMMSAVAALVLFHRLWQAEEASVALPAAGL
ncbi:MAG: cytochrome c oxidase assembly protein [Acetobacteraceae bacterium]